MHNCGGLSPRGTSMSTFSFAEGAAMFDSTPIENLFLLEYLPTAPEAFLRVYLYTRVLALHPELGDSLQQIALTLRMEEDTVFQAFAYWEQRGLVRRLTDRPPTYELLPLRADSPAALNPMERDYYRYRDFNASLQSLFGEKVIESHEYRTANDWLTKDEKIVDAYNANPLNNFKFTVNAFFNMFSGIEICSDPANIAKIPKTFPILIVSGADDPVGGFGKGVKQVADAYKKAGLTDVQMKLYEGDRHEILNELDHDVVDDDILSWLNQKMP